MVAEGGVPAGTGPGAGRRRLGWMNAITIALLVVAATLGVLYLLPANEYLLLPGDAVPVGPLISVQGHPPKAGSGSLYLTDVTFVKADRLLIELYGRLNPQAELVKASDFTGGVSESQYIKLNKNLMDQSVLDAKAAALSLFKKYRPHLASTGPQIAGVLPKTAAARELRAGDVIEYMSGRRIRRADQVRPLVQRLKPGALAHLRILRRKRLIHLDVRTVRANKNGYPDKKGTRPLIGILVQDQVVFPIKVSISPGAIVGPSAGLMFSLGIVQRLTPRDITKGCKVAGTGTIDFGGNVGVIGGAKQKVIAANNAGVKYFFVPAARANRVPAERNRGSVTIVPVKTLRQALSYLRRIPPCSGK